MKQNGRLRAAARTIAVGIALTGSPAVGVDGDEPDVAALDLPLAPTQADCLAYAALRNPGLEAAYDRWQAALARVPQARRPPNPRISYANYIQEVETRVGPQQHRFGISQMFPWFGTLAAKGNAAMAAAEAAYEEYEAAKFQLFYDVTAAWYEYYFLSRAIAVTGDNLEFLKRLEGVARAKHRAGGSQTAVIKAQVELGKLDDRLRTLRELRGPLAARLNAALNRPAGAPIPWPDEPPLTEVRFSDQDLVDRLAARNPELRAWDRRIGRERHAVEAARKAGYPGVMLGVEYIVTGEARAAGVAGSGDDPVIAMIALDLPIWRNAVRAEVAEAQSRESAAERTRQDRVNRLQADLRMALYRFRDAERKRELYGATLIPQAVQALEVTEQAYRAGTAGFLDLIDAERLLLDFQLTRERAVADREIALAEVDKLTGGAVTDAQPEPEDESS